MHIENFFFASEPWHGQEQLRPCLASVNVLMNTEGCSDCEALDQDNICWFAS
jgi:hypothetical protein